MDIRNILVPLYDGGTDSALTTALLFARKFGAHISALVATGDARDVAPLAGEGLSGAMVEEMMQATEAEDRKRVLQIKAKFDAFTQKHDLRPQRPLSWDRSPDDTGLSASFDIVTGSAHDAVVWRARLADMTVVPHMSETDNARATETLHAILFDSGRPLIVAPPRIPAVVGRRLCIAWNGTAEASAALRSTLAVAQSADAVRVLVSPDYHRIGPEGERVIAYLNLHGVHADLHEFRSIDRSVGAGMLAAARAFEADMLSLGAYSHSRLRQMIIGGVTRHVLEKADLTVLMSR
ncbi:universal stress protein [Tanticharoenia sakaeratensis]|nr:universal stress protein [Tanticharoenia sakaeratensis]